MNQTKASLMNFEEFRSAQSYASQMGVNVGGMDNVSRSYDTSIKFVDALRSQDLENEDILEILSQTSKNLPPVLREAFFQRVSMVVKKSVFEINRLLQDYESAKDGQSDETGLRYVSDLIPVFPFTSFKMPSGYTVVEDKTTKLYAIYNTKGRKEKLVTTVPVFPFKRYVDIDGVRQDAPEQYQLVYFGLHSRKWEISKQVYNASTLFDAVKTKMLSDIGVAVGSSNAAELARFFQDFIEANATIIETITTVSCYGWTTGRDGTRIFVPFSGEQIEIRCGTGGYAQIEGTHQDIVKKTGTKKGALKIVDQLKDHPPFLVMLAGTFASPVVSLINDLMAECIGIDLVSKTSTGKTTLQRICLNLVYGKCDSLVRSWQNASKSGVFEVISKANHLPVILDDSHQMHDSLSEIPHALINGIEGDKMQVNRSTGNYHLRERRHFRCVIFFNGEMSIFEKALQGGSRGLYGRVLGIFDSPFPSHFDAATVDKLKMESYDNCGQLRDEWLTYLSCVPVKRVKQQVRRIAKYMGKRGVTGVFSRLAMKSAVLVWSLYKAEKVVGLPKLNIKRLIQYLIGQMKSASSESDILKEIVRDIAQYVLQNCAEGESFHPFNQRPREGLYIEGRDTFLVHPTVVKKIVGQRREYKFLINELLKEGYVRKKGKRFTFDKYDGRRTSDYGVEFDVKVIEKKAGFSFTPDETEVQGPPPKYALSHTPDQLEQLQQKYGADKTILLNVNDGNSNKKKRR